MVTLTIDDDIHEKLQLLVIWYKRKLNLSGRFPLNNVVRKLVEDWEEHHGKITIETAKSS